MTSFRRIEAPLGGGGGVGGGIGVGLPAPPVRAPGTKPWINGQSLVSSGNRDLDGLLGGGICLGTLTLLEEDRFSDHALTLARYFLAQGVSSAQRCLVVGAEERAALEAAMVQALPYDLTFKKESTAATATDEASTAGDKAPPAPATPQRPPTSTVPGLSIPPSLLPPSATSAAAGAGPGADALNIAWQYRKYMPGGQAGARTGGSVGGVGGGGGASSSFCHSYDLSRPVQPELLAAAPPQVLDVSNAAAAAGGGGQYEAVYEAVVKAVTGLPPRTVLRVVVKSLLDRAANWDVAGWRQALHLLHSLRALARGGPVAILVTVPAHHLTAPQARLFARVADTALQLDSFASRRHQTPPEFKAFAGLLYLRALQHANALAPVRGASNKLGVKRDRRKLHIEPLHLPPEGVRSLTEDVERDKSRARAKAAKKEGSGGGGGIPFREPGMICATGGGGGGKAGAIDF